MPLLPVGPESEGLFASPALASVPGLLHGFTGRRFAGAGCGGHAIEEAVRHLAGGAALRVRTARQVHGATALDVGADDAAARGEADADALVSRQPGILAAVLTADCVPVLAVAVERGRPVAVAAIHAGWRGLAAGVVEAGLAALTDAAAGASVLATLGPCIGPCCYEVGEDVAARLADRAGASVVAPVARGSRPHADLPAGARALLERGGARVLDGPPPCTRCDPERFHSYRAEGPAAGRMTSFIGLLPEGA